MTKKELQQLYYLNKEIDLLKKQINNISPKITTDKVSSSYPEFPYTPHSITITGLDEKEYSRKLRRLERKLKLRLNEIMNLVEEINEYIDSIDDSLIRQIIVLRYINNLTWEQVATHMGGNNTADSVRKAAERFLK